MRKYVFMLLLVLFTSDTIVAEADEHRFESMSEGIINAPTRTESQQPTRTRSLTRSLSPGMRAIKVVRDQGKTVEETLMVSKVPTPYSVNLKIEFDANSCAIRPESFILHNELGKTLTNHRIKEKTLILKGHTDSDCSDDCNLNPPKRPLSFQHYLIVHTPSFRQKPESSPATAGFLDAGSGLPCAQYGGRYDKNVSIITRESGIL